MEFLDLVKNRYYQPNKYSPREAAPLIGENDTDVVRHDLFAEPAPAHTKNYMLGLDVIGWKTGTGTDRSQLIINQKSGALVLPFAVVTTDDNPENNGVWYFLQETFRGPHSKEPARHSVKEIIAAGTYSELGIYSLEAPAGGLNYNSNGQPVEEPRAAAVREAMEETGLRFQPDDLIELLPEGLHIGGDINTKITYPFLVNVSSASLDRSSRAVEEDEGIGELLAFRVRSFTELSSLIRLTRHCAGTSFALARSAALREVIQTIQE